MREHVKPCPLCGGTNIYIMPREFYYELRGRYGEAMLFVQCKDCDLELKEFTFDVKGYDARRLLLLRKWNRRAKNDQ